MYSKKGVSGNLILYTFLSLLFGGLIALVTVDVVQNSMLATINLQKDLGKQFSFSETDLQNGCFKVSNIGGYGTTPVRYAYSDRDNLWMRSGCCDSDCKDSTNWDEVSYDNSGDCGWFVDYSSEHQDIAKILNNKNKQEGISYLNMLPTTSDCLSECYEVDIGSLGWGGSTPVRYAYSSEEGTWMRSGCCDDECQVTTEWNSVSINNEGDCSNGAKYVYDHMEIAEELKGKNKIEGFMLLDKHMPRSCALPIKKESINEKIANQCYWNTNELQNDYYVAADCNNPEDLVLEGRCVSSGSNLEADYPYWEKETLIDSGYDSEAYLTSVSGWMCKFDSMFGSKKSYVLCCSV